MNKSYYRMVNVRGYVVAVNTEYNVSVNDPDLMTWEAEDKAYDIIEGMLKQYDVDEYDIDSKWEMNSLFGGHIVKVRVNMVVPAEASDYDEALSVAESYVDDFTEPEGVHGISIGVWDAELKADKGMLQRCKGA